MVTLLALCAGLTSIRMAIEERWSIALLAIFLAAILDGLDGRVARLLNGTSKFGAELDSLADFVNFGVAPAILIYAWILEGFESLGWLAAMLYAISGALRLARFNVALDDPNKPAWANRFFTGVPAPAGAIIVLLPLYMEQLGLPHYNDAAPLVAIYTVFSGLLMVSQLPTYSGKQMGTRIKRQLVMPIIVVLVALVGLLISYPFQFLTVITIAYLISIPFSWRSYKKLCKKDGTSQWCDDDSVSISFDDEDDTVIVSHEKKNKND
nr:CDP-diacylglycerol--serine O-phosphatidyltransferase [Pseudovibrio stylochi]